jgi:hypothetical protein
MGCRSVPSFEALSGEPWTSRARFRRWLRTKLPRRRQAVTTEPRTGGGVILFHPDYEFRQCRCAVFHLNILGVLIALGQGVYRLARALAMQAWRQPHDSLFADTGPHWFPADNCVCGHRFADHMPLHAAVDERVAFLETEYKLWDFYRIDVRHLTPPEAIPRLALVPPDVVTMASAVHWKRHFLHRCLPLGKDTQVEKLLLLHGTEVSGGKLRTRFVHTSRRLPHTLGGAPLSRI